ncbi:MAG: LLM class flavin-dependent oxidoreductase [Chloroflexi bacterium]|nr:LLM class flavin-dependent oxidoreductase [Chloroflexota bacterium]
MKFGIVLYPHFPAEMTATKALEYALRQVRAAREGGFDGVFASQHFAMGATEQMFQPIPLLARVAAEAQGMTLGTSVFLLSLHQPLEAAELTATLDIISGGRFRFGVGMGYRDVEFASLGIPKNTRSGRLEEAVAVVRRLWAEDNVTWKGKYFQLQNVTISPKPVQRPGPPIWVGADTLPGVARAARIGDAWLTSPRHSRTFIREAVKVYREQRQALGLPVNPPIFFREMYVASSRKDAEQEIRDSFERLYHAYHRHGQPGERYDLNFEELKEQRIVVGDPREVTQEVRRYQEEFGADYMFFRLYYLGMDPEKSVECIRLFGREVIPAFAGVARKA